MKNSILDKIDPLERDLLIFLIVHFLIWSLVPLFRSNIPMDSIEAIVWGRSGGWMTDKHPPFSGFIANIFFRICCGKDFFIYVLSQIFILIGFIYIYKLARLFLDKKESILAVLLLEGTIYYGFTSIEFNVNIISLALWPMTIYYFYRVLDGDKIKDWIILGLLVGINILNKYNCVSLFLGMFAYLLTDKNNRRQFLNKNLYIAGFIALLLIFPHLYCLFKTKFVVFEYFKSRSVFSDELGLLANIIFPIRFLFSQLVAGAATIMIFFVAYFKSKEKKLNISYQNMVFLICVGILPIFITILPSLISGVKIKSMWGSPLLYMLGLMLFVFFPFKLTDDTYKKMKCSVYWIMAFMAIFTAFNIFFSNSIRVHFPRERFVEDFSNYWLDRTNNSKLKYVIGDIWYTSNLSIYGNSNPDVILNIDKYYKKKLTVDRLNKYGIIIFGTSIDEVLFFQDYLNVNEPVEEYIFYTRNSFNREKKHTLYYSIVPPKIIGGENE